jgi:hypothetical protein
MLNKFTSYVSYIIISSVILLSVVSACKQPIDSQDSNQEVRHHFPTVEELPNLIKWAGHQGHLEGNILYKGLTYSFLNRSPRLVEALEDITIFKEKNTEVPILLTAHYARTGSVGEPLELRLNLGTQYYLGNPDEIKDFKFRVEISNTITGKEYGTATSYPVSDPKLISLIATKGKPEKS